ncbi:hypothetical protein B296_00016151 [Ensete ventricosum]|uniref:Uncharacterized protein n=1 Tax=Ensete ventricosum TaxID=4639 RepID=A0A427AI72_ENSVE|nr:hypothetical protein B296_00016151 [Ensete ventricosum]
MGRLDDTDARGSDHLYERWQDPAFSGRGSYGAHGKRKKVEPVTLRVVKLDPVVVSQAIHDHHAHVWGP